MIDKFYAKNITEKHKRISIDNIKSCITKNYEQYKNKPFIASNYDEIRDRLPL